LGDDERLAVVLADVVDSDDMRVVAEAAHRLRLAPDARDPGLVEALCLDHREGDVAVEFGVVREVDLLAPAFTKEALHQVAAAGEGRWEGRRWRPHRRGRSGSRSCFREAGPAAVAEPRAGGVGRP